MLKRLNKVFLFYKLKFETRKLDNWMTYNHTGVTSLFGAGVMQRTGARKEWSCLSTFLPQGKSYRTNGRDRSRAKRWQEDLLHSLENTMIRNRFQLFLKFSLYWTTGLPRNEDTQIMTYTSPLHLHCVPTSHKDTSVSLIQVRETYLWSETVVLCETLYSVEESSKANEYFCDIL